MGNFGYRTKSIVSPLQANGDIFAKVNTLNILGCGGFTSLANKLILLLLFTLYQAELDVKSNFIFTHSEIVP